MATSETTLSKQERREAAREEARKLREEQERREKRNKNLMIAGVVAVIVVVALAVFAIIQNSNKSHFEGVAQPTGSVEGGIPISTSHVAGIEGEGVRLDVWLDYTCSWCGVFEDTYSEYLREATAAGEVSLWLHPVSQMDGSGDYSGFSGLANNAASTVATYAPEQFLDFHDQLFLAFNETAGLPEIEAAAAAVGVPQDVIARFADGEFKPFVSATTANFLSNIAPGTPEVRVEGETLSAWTEAGSLQAAIEAAK